MNKQSHLPADRGASGADKDLLSGANISLALPSVDSDLITLNKGSVAELALARCARADRELSPTGYIEPAHFVVPLTGSYIWHRPTEQIFADANRVLFFAGRESYATSHPVSGDVSIAITPSAETVEALVKADRIHRGRQILGKSAAWPASPSVQLMSRAAVFDALAGATPLEIDDAVLQILQAAVAAVGPVRSDTSANRRVISRTKEFLHWNSGRKITLQEVADAVGLNAIYLSQVFTKCEGEPLYKYMRRLRLAASLNHIRDCDDLTALALNVGFSSHSHYSSVFLATFKKTPSYIRDVFRGSLHAKPASWKARPLSAARGGPRLTPCRPVADRSMRISI
ncbi:hypothetical protein SPAN111604_13130 [Sphingomonas antarctica]|uniref:helix-turn-helix transcriptional regulator n=1 Tax=Sphingomonas antarctica TaxID=2040274 RepID=UPI0039EB46D4